MPVITVSSSFGSAGSVVANSVATSLGWTLLNRAITVEVAAQLSVPLELAEAHDERAQTGWRRLLENFSMHTAPLTDGPAAIAAPTDELRLRQATEFVLRDVAKSNAVIVGRAAAIVLRNFDRALHVRLDGPRTARLKQGAQALGLSLSEAEVLLEKTDRARAAYVREMYGQDWRDPSLYHLILDSTAFSIETCSKLILAAAQGRFEASTEGPSA